MAKKAKAKIYVVFGSDGYPSAFKTKADAKDWAKDAKNEGLLDDDGKIHTYELTK